MGCARSARSRYSCGCDRELAAAVQPVSRPPLGPIGLRGSSVDGGAFAITIVCVDGLLERESELEALMTTVEAVRGGRGAVVLVAGEAGIGKTSLLRALRDLVSLPFYVGRCEPLSVPEPMGPVRELAAGAGAADMPELAAGDRRGLARALQAALTSKGPAVAAIEDVHWADPATLDVVRILARRAEDVPLALFVTLRDDELAANASLAVLVGDLATEPAVTRVRPRPLSLGAVRALARVVEPT